MPTITPSAKIACRLALANYLRTNLSSPWPNLVVSENWPTPQKAFPPQAITIVTPSAGQVVQYHQPVVWSVTPTTGVNADVVYSYGIVEIPLQLDVWAQFEALRDDLAAYVTPLLNKNPDITLGTTSSAPEFSVSAGLVIPVPTYFNVTAEFLFEPVPQFQENPDSAMTGDWRATWLGTATIYLMATQNVSTMTDITIQLKAGPDPSASTDIITIL